MVYLCAVKNCKKERQDTQIKKETNKINKKPKFKKENHES